MVHLIKLHQPEDNNEVLINPNNITYIERNKSNSGSKIMFNAIGYSFMNNINPQSLEVVESLDEILSLIIRS
jgi:hypothetical protein